MVNPENGTRLIRDAGSIDALIMGSRSASYSGRPPSKPPASVPRDQSFCHQLADLIGGTSDVPPDPRSAVGEKASQKYFRQSSERQKFKIRISHPIGDPGIYRSGGPSERSVQMYTAGEVNLSAASPRNSTLSSSVPAPGARRASARPVSLNLIVGGATATNVAYGSKPEKLHASICFPLFTQQRTSPRYFGMSVSCHDETHAPQQNLIYSITSSARARSAGGMVSPSALAVLRLITSSNLVGCSTGRSAGFAPLRILSTYSAARRKVSAKPAP
jgi:hypothetical protein